MNARGGLDSVQNGDNDPASVRTFATWLQQVAL